MKKTFSLDVAGRDAARTVEAVKHEVRKYLKRERRKTVPEGADFWDFDCKLGRDAATATVTDVAGITPGIDTLAQEGSTHAYVEILAKPGHRIVRPSPVENAEPTPPAPADEPSV